MIDQQGSLLIEGYEDVVSREIRLGICEACLTSLGLSNKTEVEDMEKSDVIMEELAQLSEQLAACIEKLVRVRSLMFDSVVCEICRERLADSICNCGLDLCTTCEQNHRHMNISQ